MPQCDKPSGSDSRMQNYPTLEDFATTRRLIAPYTRTTPCISLPAGEIPGTEGGPELVFKLELLQVTGTFKARGALAVMLALAPDARDRGVTAVSAGNHAIAVAYAARALGMTAKLVVMKTINPARLQRVRDYGAEVEIAADGKSAFARAAEIVAAEGRTMVHPFEGPLTAAGAGTAGIEWLEQAPGLDAVVIAVGGGGLIAGVSSAVKQVSPTTRVFGVEPVGADSLTRSLAAGGAIPLPPVSTVADSLAPPMTLPYSFGVCQRFVDSVACVTDEQMRRAMGTTFASLKLAVEPAGAAALAGVLGPLRPALAGMRRVGVFVCGSNIDLASYAALALA